jgi:hypothetical protein
VMTVGVGSIGNAACGYHASVRNIHGGVITP